MRSGSDVSAAAENLRPDRQDDALRLSFPAESIYIAMARLFAASVARHYGCPEEIVDDVKVAISETVTNAVKAHQRVSTDAPVLLKTRTAEGSLRFDVVDQGPGFDHEQGSVIESAHPAVLRRGSLGLALVRSMFQTDIRRNPGGGMTVGFLVELTPALD
jgi:serine/threonine-protein kinase RsbW